jgi:hypothetical protein
MDTNFKSIQQLGEDSVARLNERIKDIDWNSKWQKDYQKTHRAKQEVETLKKPEVKEALKEVFSEQSLVMSRLEEVF